MEKPSFKADLGHLGAIESERSTPDRQDSVGIQTGQAHKISISAESDGVNRPILTATVGRKITMKAEKNDSKSTESEEVFGIPKITAHSNMISIDASQNDKLSSISTNKEVKEIQIPPIPHISKLIRFVSESNIECDTERFKNLNQEDLGIPAVESISK